MRPTRVLQQPNTATVDPTRKQSPSSASAQQCCCACSCGRKSAAPSLFVDEEFPARWFVLFNPSVAAAWLRPHEIRREPRLFVEGSSRFAVQQGCLEDSWFIAACAAVAERPDLLKQLVPENQVLYGPGYDGSVTFRFWHLGEWQEVRIDDRIPVDARGVPVYARCKHKDEFWLPLLEKAFAKFHRSYCYLHRRCGDTLADGLINLTGYCLKRNQVLKFAPECTFYDLKSNFDVGAMITCKSGTSGPGLPGCHVYTITKVFHRFVDKENAKEGEEEMRMVRVRNPWGTEVEWAGAWKDGDERWGKLSNEIKEAMEYKPEDDGEFWMDIKDFSDNFTEVCFATEKPQEAQKMKLVGQVKGHWTADEESGGHPDDINRFANNPQFLLMALGVLDQDDEEEEEEKMKKEEEKNRKEKDESKEKTEEEQQEAQEEEEPFNPMNGMETIVELLQEHNRKKRLSSYEISYYVFETCTERRLTAEEMLEMTYVTGATDVTEGNAVLSRVRLHPGRRYVIVPTTLSAGQEGDFLLRVFSRHARVRLVQLSS